MELGYDVAIIQNHSILISILMSSQARQRLHKHAAHPPPASSQPHINSSSELFPITYASSQWQSMSNKHPTEQQALQDSEMAQSNTLSPAPSIAEAVRKRPRKTLTKSVIHQLNEAFSLYEQQSSRNEYCLTQLAKVLKIGYSTILRKYGEFKTRSYVKEGRRLTEYPKQYNKSRLARCLISRSLQEDHKLSNSREISSFIMERYGLYYNSTLINSQLRRLGLNKGRESSYSIQRGSKKYLCDQCLMQSLLKMCSKMVYLGKIRLTLQDEEAIIVLLASKFGVAIQMVQEEVGLCNICILLQQFCSRFSSRIQSLWYLVTNEETIYWNSPGNKKQTYFTDILPSHPKIILLGSSCTGISPAYHLLEQISAKIKVSSLTCSQAMASLPQWLSTQQESAQKFITQAEQYLLKLAHSCSA